MLFNSVDFILFFPIVVILYFAIPQKIRNLFLLVCSIYFYMCWKAKYILLIGFSIVVTYIAGILMEYFGKRNKQGWRKATLVIALILNLFVLFVFKYYNFFVENIERFTGNRIMLPVLVLALPVGISFYTFQALGYAIDVYQKTVPAEKNILTYALFVSFFPQLVAGPIERSSNLLPQMCTPRNFSFENMRSGLFLMGCGYFQKLVIADRLALFVNSVYNNYETAGGEYLLLATIVFAFQIYCDFASYSNIAIGAARVMGFSLMTNFNTPYFAKSMADYWSRWHISLSTWFQDYIFEPLVWGSKNPQRMTLFALLVVFTISGIWHGASWTYLVWGLIHAAYRIIGVLTRKSRRNIYKKLHINLKSAWFGFGQMLTTFLLVCFTYIFFRSETLSQAFAIIAKIFTQCNISAIFTSALFNYKIDVPDLVVAIIGLLVLLCADIFTYKKIDIYAYIVKCPIAVRWLAYWLIIFSSVIVGVYGPAYDSAPFIYFQF